MLARQLVWVVISTLVLAIAAAVPYRRLRDWSYPALLAALVLLVLVLLMPARNGSRSWFALGPFTFQPSEFAKLACVLAVSRYLVSARRVAQPVGFRRSAVMTLPIVVLVLREPDLGTATIFLPVLFAMLYAAGAGRGIWPPSFWRGRSRCRFCGTRLNAEQRSRITAVFRQHDGGTPAKGDDYHLHQSKQVIALGGVWGSDLAGMPLAESEAYHLPAARTDFVFCLVAERWGIGGARGGAAGVLRSDRRSPADWHGNRRSVRPADLRRHRDVAGNAGDHQHRDDGRPGSDYGHHAAAAELWRLEHGGDVRRDWPRDQRRDPARLRSAGAVFDVGRVSEELRATAEPCNRSHVSIESR